MRGAFTIDSSTPILSINLNEHPIHFADNKSSDLISWAVTTQLKVLTVEPNIDNLSIFITSLEIRSYLCYTFNLAS
jgi:hypothetical protein